MIRYYLGEEPILAQRRDLPPAREPKQREHVLENLDKLVVKAVGESGGYGMLIGPHSHRSTSATTFAEKINADPRNYIAQPTIELSRAPSFIDDGVEGAPRRSAALHPLRRKGHRRARRPDPRRAAQRLAGRQLLPGRRQQGHLGAAATDTMRLSSSACVWD